MPPRIDRGRAHNEMIEIDDEGDGNLGAEAAAAAAAAAA